MSFSRVTRPPHAVTVDHLLLQQAVDTLPYSQAALVGLDVDIRRVDEHGVLEHRLDELDDRRVGRAFLRRQRLQVDVGLAELLVELLGQRHDLVRAPIDEIDRAQQRRLFHEREPHRLLQHARELVEREQVRRVRHALRDSRAHLP